MVVDISLLHCTNYDFLKQIQKTSKYKQCENKLISKYSVHTSRVWKAAHPRGQSSAPTATLLARLYTPHTSPVAGVPPNT